MYKVQDWDDAPGAIDWDKFANFITRVKDEGVLPEHASHDHLNPQLKDTPVSREQQERWANRFQEVVNKLLKDDTRVVFVLLDGFLLYWDKVKRSVDRHEEDINEPSAGG